MLVSLRPPPSCLLLKTTDIFWSHAFILQAVWVLLKVKKKPVSESQVLYERYKQHIRQLICSVKYLPPPPSFGSHTKQVLSGLALKPPQDYLSLSLWHRPPPSSRAAPPRRGRRPPHLPLRKASSHEARPLLSNHPHDRNIVPLPCTSDGLGGALHGKRGEERWGSNGVSVWGGSRGQGWVLMDGASWEGS